MLSNPILPFFCFRPYLDHSTPFPSTASRRFTGPAVGRELDGEEPEQNVLILLCLQLFQPYAELCVCAATGRRGRVGSYPTSYSVDPSQDLVCVVSQILPKKSG